VVRRTRIEACERDRVAPADPGVCFLVSQCGGFAILHNARIRIRAYPTDHRGVRRDALNVRLARGRICPAGTAEERPRGPQHPSESASFEVSGDHLTCATRYRGGDTKIRPRNEGAILYESLLCINQPTASEAISGGIVCPPSNSR
jgi:hypothetical protein